MRPVDIISAKRDGQEHSRADLAAFLGGYLRGTVADYQMAAWLMAVVWRGMTRRFADADRKRERLALP